MNDDSREDSAKESEAGETPDLGRRKLLYFAPAVMSAKLFNSLAGCGKVNPTDNSCGFVQMQS